ncbi:MAG: hypothetical protein RLZ14_2196 [Actinomycetota bacterium]|jgi:hypothetical protein
MSHHVEVSQVVAATPERVYELVSDLPRMGEWSPENTGGKWLKGARPATLGAKFKGSNAKGVMRWSTLATVTRAEPGRAFAFDVTAHGLKVAGWGFDLEAVDGGTRVTQWWDDHRNPVMARVTGMALRVPDRPSHNRAGMERTLAAMAAAV